MRLDDLGYLDTCTLAVGQSLYRVQRAGLRRGTVRRGPLKLAPAGLLGGRFDLTGAPTAYLAEAPETALYEAVARREAMLLSLAQLAQRELTAVQTRRELTLGDLRPHTSSWPVLQSLRHAETQALATQAQAAGFAGLVYRSAQHFGQDCFVLFDPPAACIKPLWRTPLVNAAGSIHHWVAQVVRGSRLPLTP